jgi:Holliday junction resolvase-like predicted endonuclease
MKMQTQGLLLPLNKEEMINLTTEVKEVLATGVIKTWSKKSNKKIFSAAELWNIQRNQKARVQRRFAWV